jgi:hypothetical protein
MLETRLSRLLLVLGTAVGLAATGVWALDVQVDVPDWMIRVAMLKLAFAGSLGLLAAGALIGRHAKTRSVPLQASAALSEGTPGPAFSDPRTKEVIDVQPRDQPR